MMPFLQIAVCVLGSQVPMVPTGDNPSADPFAGRENFQVADHAAFLLAPAKPAEQPGGKPWVWYAPTLGDKHPGKRDEGWMFQRFHAAGIAIAGVDVGESYGSPRGRAVFQSLYDAMVQRGYSRKPVLLARSRGGLMLYNWAVEHPGSVGAVAGIYPVCSIASYPGVAKAAPAYGMTADQLEAKLAEHNPIDRLAPLAKAKVPIFHLQGDADRVVPLAKNTAILAERYRALGGPVEVEVIPGGGHDLKRHWFESQTLVDFVVAQAKARPAAPAAAAGEPKLFRLPGLVVNLTDKVVDVDAKVCLEQGYLEFVACTPDTKEHESIVVIDAKPQHVHAAMLLIGLRNGNPAMQKRIGEGDQARWISLPPRGDKVELSLVFPGRDNKPMEYPVGDFISWAEEGPDGEVRDGEPPQFPKYFLFAGSHIIDQNPNPNQAPGEGEGEGDGNGQAKGKRIYIADESGSVVSIATFGDEVICLSGKHSAENGELVWEINPELLPKVGSKVKLRIRKYTPAPGDEDDE